VAQGLQGDAMVELQGRVTGLDGDRAGGVGERQVELSLLRIGMRALAQGGEVGRVGGKRSGGFGDVAVGARVG
jgi:hypothetical protein